MPYITNSIRIVISDIEQANQKNNQHLCKKLPIAKRIKTFESIIPKYPNQPQYKNYSGYDE
jgi:hypothetical protein